jgi:hypothetical protein
MFLILSYIERKSSDQFVWFAKFERICDLEVKFLELCETVYKNIIYRQSSLKGKLRVKSLITILFFFLNPSFNNK